MFGWSDFREDGKWRTENNVFGYLVEGGKEERFWWDLQVFSFFFFLLNYVKVIVSHHLADILILNIKKKKSWYFNENYIPYMARPTCVGRLIFRLEILKKKTKKKNLVCSHCLLTWNLKNLLRLFFIWKNQIEKEESGGKRRNRGFIRRNYL